MPESFETILDKLMSEFADSGMTMDDFIKEKLKESGRKDAAECAEEIISTINEIDKKFTNLQKFKEAGGNREEWLREEMNDALKDVSAADAGKFLTAATNSLNGEADLLVDDAPEYSGFDAPFLIRALDDAIVKNTCDNLTTEEK